ncbi:hypothetical protein L1049_007738 [Liquidambar formosana]|uniref:Small auxin up regulated protein n=1 Tax=Liquidambar formosana TaxID=63359 RepID=A0AAP0X4X5_LIQFO
MSNTAGKNREERKRCLALLKHFIERLQVGLSLLPSRELDLNDEELKAAPATATATFVPDDVKEGHFAVFAVEGGEPKRFIVELCYLSNPSFLSLLEQAEEEYGFQQKGALAVPCRPEELQKILEERRKLEEW